LNRPTQSEVDALIAKHGPDLTEVEAGELYAIARKPTRDEAAAHFNGILDAARRASENNNLLCKAVVWPAVSVWQAMAEKCPGIIDSVAAHVSALSYPESPLTIAEGEAGPAEHQEALAAARAAGARLCYVLEGKLYGFRGPGRWDFEAAGVKVSQGQHFEAYEAIALKCCVFPSPDAFKDALKALPGSAAVVGPFVKDLGEFKGAVKTGKLKASSTSP
jgi:hypothetical protein